MFYIAPDQKLMAVPVTSDAASFEAGIAQPLFEVRAAFPMFARGYDVSADGKRFLINTAFQESSTQPIHVIVNWPAKFSRDK